ncbi:MAG: hypothetical protein RL596_2346 [Bacteroidota bacterium]
MTNDTKTIAALLQDIAKARSEYISLVDSINEDQAAHKISADTWNIIDITEHLFWAEQGAIYGMWKTLLAIRNGSAEKTYSSIHQNWTIEKIIEHTWKEKEEVPAVAAPRLGGTLRFWAASLSNLQQVLESFGNDLQMEELRLIAHPHPISGAMDFHQRLEFLRFHIQRHFLQVQTILHQL